MTSYKKTTFGKDIFLTGKYVQHFNPDDRQNPFFKIYKQKKQDAIDIINKSDNPKTILDVGGGMGRVSLALAESAQNKIVLMDISMDMLKLAQNHATDLNNIQVVKADAHHLPFKNNSFDHLLGLDLLCHLEKPEKALYEFHRVLTDQGILILDSTNSNPVWALFYPRYLGKNPLNWLRIMKYQGNLPGWETIVKHYSKKHFFSLIDEMGFKVIRNLNYGPTVCPKWHLAVAKRLE